jgi:hypothetical protein
VSCAHHITMSHDGECSDSITDGGGIDSITEGEGIDIVSSIHSLLYQAPTRLPPARLHPAPIPRPSCSHSPSAAAPTSPASPGLPPRTAPRACFRLGRCISQRLAVQTKAWRCGRHEPHRCPCAAHAVRVTEPRIAARAQLMPSESLSRASLPVS